MQVSSSASGELYGQEEASIFPWYLGNEPMHTMSAPVSSGTMPLNRANHCALYAV